jgi:hypothetical protein
MPIIDRLVFELIDKTIQVLYNSLLLFGSKTVIRVGDFCQVAPVVKNSSQSAVAAASIKSSIL